MPGSLFIALPCKAEESIPGFSPKIISLSFTNSLSDSVLVRMSVSWSSDFTDCISKFTSSMSLKCQYLLLMCLVLGLYLGVVARVLAHELSSNTLLFTTADQLTILIFSSLIASIKFIMGIVVHIPSLRAMNSASIVLSAVSLCI